MLPGHAGYQASPRPETQSTQWESNPRFRHGEAAGYRYIMGAWLEAELSKIGLLPVGLVGLEPSSPHYESGVFAAGSPVRVPVRMAHAVPDLKMPSNR